ncbi:MAG: stage II sporulation protein M [Solirubrobacteraceae bacterium]
MDDTRATLRRWNAAPASALIPWSAGALGVSIALLYAVWVVSHAVRPDPSGLLLPGLNTPGSPASVCQVLWRNALVLALHALACVAGFIAGSSLPLQAEHHRGFMRRLHEHAGKAAIAFVGCATAFSLGTQAFVLGSDAATLATQLRVGQLTLMLTLLPHALPELFALFLPLAAWILASRRGRWDELLAATFATTLIAVPVLIVAANIEVFVWPHLMQLASPRY